MKRNGRLIERIVTQESVNRYVNGFMGVKKVVEPLNNTSIT